MIRTLNRGFKLWRYDLEQPPKNWSIDFKEYKYDIKGKNVVKNQIGAFYFFDRLEQAQHPENINNVANIWITESHLVGDVRLLDICGHDTKNVKYEKPLHILIALYEFGIDVLIPEFKKYNEDGTTVSFSEIRDDFLHILDLDQEKEIPLCEQLIKIRLATKINKFFCDSVQYFSQLLTDFENGNYWKNILKGKGLDGYIFLEAKKSDTYCFFESKHLASPEVQKRH